MKKYGHYLENPENITENLDFMNYAEKVRIYGILRMMELTEIQGKVFDQLEKELPPDASDEQIEEAMKKHLVEVQEKLLSSNDAVKIEELLKKVRE